MVYRPRQPAPCLRECLRLWRRRQKRRHGGRHRWRPSHKTGLCGAGRIGEFDGDGLSGALWDGAVQHLDGAFGLEALIEANEANAL